MFFIQSARTVQDAAKEIKIQQVSINTSPTLASLLERKMGEKLVTKKKGRRRRTVTKEMEGWVINTNVLRQRGFGEMMRPHVSFLFSSISPLLLHHQKGHLFLNAK